MLINIPLIVLLFVKIYGNPVDIQHYEDLFQTQINLKEPKYFKSVAWKTLSARQNAIERLIYHFPNGTNIQRRVDPSVFTRVFGESYRYNKREKYLQCPQTPQGIATYCDWALMIPCLFGDPTKPPRTFFIHHMMLAHFVENMLPNLPVEAKFVIITSGTDQTIPMSRKDVRFNPLRGFLNDASGGPYWQVLLNSSKIVHIYSENHDLNHVKVSTLPTGFVYIRQSPDDHKKMLQVREKSKPLTDRPLQFLVAHRTRSGVGQWYDRAWVNNQCKLKIQNAEKEGRETFCIMPSDSVRKGKTQGINENMYLNLVSSVSFVACVHGGGLDPSPKAWEALFLGTIPIIEHSTLDDAYAQLPVVFIDSWHDLFRDYNKTVEKMKKWRENLSSFYIAGSVLRKQTLYKLRTKFWFDQITNRLEIVVNATNNEK